MEGCCGTVIEGHSRERVWLFKADPYITQKTTMNLMAVITFPNKSAPQFVECRSKVRGIVWTLRFIGAPRPRGLDNEGFEVHSS